MQTFPELRKKRVSHTHTHISPFMKFFLFSRFHGLDSHWHTHFFSVDFHVYNTCCAGVQPHTHTRLWLPFGFVQSMLLKTTKKRRSYTSSHLDHTTTAGGRRGASQLQQEEWVSLKVDMKADETRQPPLTTLTKPNGTAGSTRPRHPLSDCCPAQPDRLAASAAAARPPYSAFSSVLFCFNLKTNDW